MQRLDKFLTILSIIILPFIIYLFSVSTLIFNESFYNSLFQKTGVDFENAQLLTKELFVYFKSSDSSVPSIKLLTENENSHIRDVKVVIDYVLIAFYVLIFLFAVCLLWVSDKQKMFFYGGILSVCSPLFLLLFSFGSSFRIFHLIFFPQGNWMFPQTAILVNIYTFEFFKLFALQILIIGEVISLFVVVVSLIVKRIN